MPRSSGSTDPAASALRPSLAIIGRWLGARPPVTAIWIAIEREVGEAAQGKGDDRDRAFGDKVLHLPRSMKATNSLSTILVPKSPPACSASAHGTPSKNIRRKDIAEHLLEREIRLTEQPANPAQNAVGERDQRDEGQHHRADRNGQLDPGLRALRRGHDDVGGLFLAIVARITGASCRMRSQGRVAAFGGSGIMILAIRMPPGADMKAAATR